MATLFPQRGRWVLQFNNQQQRQTIRLGQISEIAARKILAGVEQCEDELSLLGRLSAESLAWMNSAPLALRNKFMNTGLIPRSQVELSLTAFLSRFEKAQDIKDSTATFYGHTFRNLKECFGANAPLGAVVDGAKFLRHLKAEGLARATMSRRIIAARTIWNWGCRQDVGLATANPFTMIEAPSQTNEDRQYYVEAEVARRIIAAAADPNLKIAIALARFGGLRCPSEVQILRWSDIDWARNRMTIRSPKTERYAGKDRRESPIFEDLLPYLRAAFDARDEHNEFVVGDLAAVTGNALTSRLWKVMARLKIKQWAKSWVNLRASCETELLNKGLVPHVVAGWIGHSQLVQRKHYAMITEDQFQRAAGSAAAPNGHKGSGVTSNLDFVVENAVAGGYHSPSRPICASDVTASFCGATRVSCR